MTLSRSRWTATVLVAALAVLPLAACSSTAATSASGALTLAQVKSPVQLLRNEAAGRVPKADIQDVVQPTDASSDCKPEANDPDEKYRTWTSTVLLTIKFASTEKPDDIVKNVVQTFIDEGWEQGVSASEEITHLQSVSTFATIDVSDVDPDKVAQDGGQVQITVNGACVLTAGKDSLEVRNLEKTN